MGQQFLFNSWLGITQCSADLLWHRRLHGPVISFVFRINAFSPFLLK